MSKPCEVIKKILSVKKSARIKLLGDSITHGMGGTGFEQNGEVFIEGFARNPNGYCWANNFKKYIEENKNYIYYNSRFIYIYNEKHNITLSLDIYLSVNCKLFLHQVLFPEPGNPHITYSLPI